MNKTIVITTIHPPTEATMKFIEMDGWDVIVVGDGATPHAMYNRLPITYLDPDFQDKHYPELSDAIGWNCIMRRNIGFIEAYRRGADIVASVDDDNIPYPNWGQTILVGKEVLAYNYTLDSIAFDPLSVTNHPELWHRGYPIQDIPVSRTPKLTGVVKVKVQIQADLWDGDPDVDAICRYIYNPTGLKLECPYIYTSDKYIPFNSQNTFLAREVLPYYMVLPHVGRVDDIWGGYIAQYLLHIRPVFTTPTTYQDRNDQSINKNLEDEVFGYLNTREFLGNITDFKSYLPYPTLKAFELYRQAYR